MLTAIKRELNSNTIIVGALTPMGRSSRQKINKKTQILNDTLDQIDLTDIYDTFHLKAEEYSFLLKCTQSILQDKSHVGSQSKFW